MCIDRKCQVHVGCPPYWSEKVSWARLGQERLSSRGPRDDLHITGHPIPSTILGPHRNGLGSPPCFPELFLFCFQSGRIPHLMFHKKDTGFLLSGAPRQGPSHLKACRGVGRGTPIPAIPLTLREPSFPLPSPALVISQLRSFPLPFAPEQHPLSSLQLQSVLLQPPSPLLSQSQ